MSFKYKADHKTTSSYIYQKCEVYQVCECKSILEMTEKKAKQKHISIQMGKENRKLFIIRNILVSIRSHISITEKIPKSSAGIKRKTFS